MAVSRVVHLTWPRTCMEKRSRRAGKSGGVSVCPRTCFATAPPSSLLRLTYLSTTVFMKASNSSTDSGRGSSRAGLGAGGGVGAADASGGDTMVWRRSGTLLGSSVEVAMSSRRDVAASSLCGQAMGQRRAWVIQGREERAPLNERGQVVHVVCSHGDGTAVTGRRRECWLLTTGKMRAFSCSTAPGWLPRARRGLLG